MLVHSPHYVNKLMEGSLSAREELQMEIPYSPQVVDAFMLHAGGSILAAERALQDGVCVNVGGGFHHAFRRSRRRILHDQRHRGRDTGHAEARAHPARHDGGLRCSPGQWDGDHLQQTGAECADAALRFTAEFGGTRGGMSRGGCQDVFTISLHQENNYPFVKPPSSIDVNLPDGCSDEEYLAWLDNALSSGLRNFEPQLISYVAGADPFREDQLGGLNLTIEGLKRRDLLVFRAARARGIPIMVTYAGGYAIHIEDTITIHCNTILAAAEIYRQANSEAPR